MSEKLENVWKSCTKDFPKDAIESWWSLIIEKYQENGRNSHNLVHLEEKFKELDGFRQCIKDINAFTLALFFQYLEYSPMNADCHEKNLHCFSKFSSEVGISTDSDLYKEVMCLLEASAVHSTEEHKTEGAYGEEDLHYFLDLDMCILGSSEIKYQEYINNIQKEYSFLDAGTYKSLRKKVLQSFLLIPNIFATREFREKFDVQARKNISDELKSLSSS